MNLNEVRRLLSDLEKLVGGWNSVSEISAIERDLALGKLRTIYDALRFGASAETGSAEAFSPEPEVVPVPIDLSELLAPGHSVGDLLSAEPEAETSEAQSVAAEAHPVDSAVAVNPVERAERPAAALEEPAVPDAPASVAAAQAVSAEIPNTPKIATPEEKLNTPEEPKIKEQEPPRAYAAPTLFGPEEAFVRHRHKQRVIMSLYDNDPAVTRSDSRSAAPAPKPQAPAEISEPTIAPVEPEIIPAPAAPEPIPAISESVSEPVSEADTVSAEELAAAQSLATAALADELPVAESPVVEADEPVEAEQESAEREAQFAPEAEAETPDSAPAEVAVEESVPVAEQPAEAVPVATQEHAPESVFERMAAAAAEAKNTAASEPVVGLAEDSSDEEPAAISVVRSVEEQTVSVPAEDSYPTTFAEPAPESAEAEDNEEPEPFEVIRTEPETPAEPESRAENPAGAVLGEVMNHDVRTIADTIAPARDIASALSHGGRIVELRRAIGLNDKFLLIRDLFGGDAAAYEQAVNELDAFDDFDDCMIHIAEHYAWNPDSDGARLLMELLERKFV